MSQQIRAHRKWQIFQVIIWVHVCDLLSNVYRSNNQAECVCVCVFGIELKTTHPQWGEGDETFINEHETNWKRWKCNKPGHSAKMPHNEWTGGKKCVRTSNRLRQFCNVDDLLHRVMKGISKQKRTHFHISAVRLPCAPFFRASGIFLTSVRTVEKVLLSILPPLAFAFAHSLH